MVSAPPSKTATPSTDATTSRPAATTADAASLQDLGSKEATQRGEDRRDENFAKHDCFP